MALFNRSEPPFTVDVPKGAADQPSWVRIGTIAVVGFVIGIAWPKIMGVKLGPNAPQDAVAAAAVSTGAAPGAESATTAPPATPPAAAAVSANPAGSAGGTPNVEVSVKSGVLISCRTEDGTTLKGRSCGTVNFDGIAQPRIKRLGQCSAAREAQGRLGITFNLDFRTNRATLAPSKSTSMPNADALVDCLKPAFDSVSLSAVDHEHPKYAVLYNVNFGGPVKSALAPASSAGSAPTPGGATSAAASDGEAQVVWEVAIVRAEPRTGPITGRIPRGGKVRLGPAKDSWYPIHYGENFASEGWVYRAAIGR